MKSNLPKSFISTSLIIIIILSACGQKKEFPVTHLILPSEFSAEYFYMNVPLPDGIAVRSDGKLLVLNEREPQGVYLAAKGDSFDVGDAFSTTGSPFESPDDIALYPDGSVFVGDGNLGALFKINSAGGKPEVLVSKDSMTIANNFSPFGITIAPPNFKTANIEPGDIIVADNGYPCYKAVRSVNPITGETKVVAKGDIFIDGPLQVVVGPKNNLYIYQNNSSGKNRIVRLTADGKVESFLPHVPGRGGMTINPVTGDLYFGLMPIKQIWWIPTAGGYPRLFASGFKGRIQDLEFSPEGKSLYVSAKNNVIEITGPFLEPIQDSKATLGSIKGIVSNAVDKSAFANLHIAAYRGREHITSIKSDENGRYNLMLPPGKFALKPYAVESFQHDSITVVAGQEQNIDFVLTPIKIPNIVEKCVNTYKSLKGYRDKTTVSVNMIKDTKENKTTTHLIFAFERPNRFRFESITGVSKEKIVGVCDGKVFTNYIGMFGQYIQEDAPAVLTYDDLQAHMRIFFGSILVQKLALSDDPANALLAFVEKITVIKSQNFDDIPVTIIDLTLPVSSISPRFIPPRSRTDTPVIVRIWISEKDYLIQRMTYKLDMDLITDNLPDERRGMFKGMMMEMSEKHTSVELNPTFSDERFIFDPYDDAKLVKKFTPPRSLSQDLSKFKGKPAPDFTLKNLEGKEVSLIDFKGKVRILNFWATWCGPCREEIPEFIALQSEYSFKEFTIVGISLDQNAAVVRTYADKNKINYPLLMADGKVQITYGNITAIPTTFILDKNGIIRYTYIGMPSDKKVFQRNVEELLAQ